MCASSFVSWVSLGESHCELEALLFVCGEWDDEEGKRGIKLPGVRDPRGIAGQCFLRAISAVRGPRWAECLAMCQSWLAVRCWCGFRAGRMQISDIPSTLQTLQEGSTVRRPPADMRVPTPHPSPTASAGHDLPQYKQ